MQQRKVIPNRELPNAIQAAEKIEVSKKTLYFYQLTLKKAISLQGRLNFTYFFEKSCGKFRIQVYSIIKSLSLEEGEIFTKNSKSYQVKQALKQFILEF